MTWGVKMVEITEDPKIGSSDETFLLPSHCLSILWMVVMVSSGSLIHSN
jgi:hypothetical protein